MDKDDQEDRRLLELFRAEIERYRSLWGMPADKEVILNAWAIARAQHVTEKENPNLGN